MSPRHTGDQDEFKCQDDQDEFKCHTLLAGFGPDLERCSIILLSGVTGLGLRSIVLLCTNPPCTVSGYCTRRSAGFCGQTTNFTSHPFFQGPRVVIHRLSPPTMLSGRAAAAKARSIQRGVKRRLSGSFTDAGISPPKARFIGKFAK